MRRTVSMGWLASLVLLSGATLAGCPDPEGQLDEFEGNVVDGAPIANPIDGAPLDGGVPDIGGRFYVGIETPLDRNRPLRLIYDIVFHPPVTEGEPVTIDVTAQPLDVDARTPVGAPFTWTAIVVNTAGEFTLEKVGGMDNPGVLIEGEANPISGSDIEADIIQNALVKSADLWCGTVSGMVYQPISFSLDASGGSFFAATRVADDAIGDALPADPADKCPEATFDAGPVTFDAAGAD